VKPLVFLFRAPATFIKYLRIGVSIEMFLSLEIETTSQ